MTHNSKITGIVCPTVDLTHIKALSEKCCTVPILKSIKNYFVQSITCIIKTLFCNLDLFNGFAEKKITKYAYFCLPLKWPNLLKYFKFNMRYGKKLPLHVMEV